MKETITWTESEWADDGRTSELRGFVADVFISSWDDRWAWTVKATEAVSEWPELQSSGGGHRTMETAMKNAEVALRRAAKRAPERNPNTGELNNWASCPSCGSDEPKAMHDVLGCKPTRS